MTKAIAWGSFSALRFGGSAQAPESNKKFAYQNLARCEPDVWFWQRVSNSEEYCHEIFIRCTRRGCRFAAAAHFGQCRTRKYCTFRPDARPERRGHGRDYP